MRSPGFGAGTCRRNHACRAQCFPQLNDRVADATAHSRREDYLTGLQMTMIDHSNIGGIVRGAQRGSLQVIDLIWQGRNQRPRRQNVLLPCSTTREKIGLSKHDPRSNRQIAALTGDDTGPFIARNYWQVLRPGDYAQAYMVIQ